MALALAGCVHVYQPLAGLHSPVVVDTRLANFKDVDLEVRCLPSDYLNPEDSRLLCQRLGTLFENQGARVRTSTENRIQDEALPGETDATPRADLVLEVRSRQVHQAKNPLSWFLCWGTATLVPGITETTFEQEVVIRDGSGFLLVRQALQGRMVRYFGVGTWASNRLLDKLWREDADRITGDAFEQHLSSDLYEQVSQLLFNARMRQRVLQDAGPAGGRQ